MDVRITPAPLSGTLPAVASKSEAHRLFIAAALSDGETKIAMDTLSDDVSVTTDCLVRLGAKIICDGGIYTVSPGGQRSEKYDFGASGTSARFLLPIVAALCDRAEFSSSAQLAARPMSALIAALSSAGKRFNSDRLPCVCEGKIRSGEFRIPGDISSQFISGLLLTLPLLDGDSRIILTTKPESTGYTEMTARILRQFGIAARQSEDGWLVRGGQKYKSPDKLLRVGGDYSASANFIAAGYIRRRPITVTGLDKNSLQPDAVFPRLLGGFASAERSFDVSETPDIAPLLAVCAALTPGRTTIGGTARLAFKESDRQSGICDMLRSLGGEVENGDGTLTVTGADRLSGGVVDGMNDHRIVMAAAVAAVGCKAPVIIKGAEAVNKSYPGFFEDYNKLGGKAEMLK